MDPCDCARFADCRAQNHKGICTCIPDYTGDPYGNACTPIGMSFLELNFDFEVSDELFLNLLSI